MIGVYWVDVTVLVVVVLHGHAEVRGWSCWNTKNCRISDSFCRSMSYSDLSWLFSVCTLRQWYKKKRNRFESSRFSTLNRFAWFLRFSKCFCLRIRDRRADSRFDIIRLRFRSSTTVMDSAPRLWFGPSESPWFRFGSSDPEPEHEITGFREGKTSGSDFVDCKASESEFEMTGSGDWMVWRNSGQSHGVKPVSKAENGFPNRESGWIGKADSMAGNQSKEY